MTKNNNYFEIIVGTFVLLCAVFFFFSSFSKSKINNSDNYSVIAKFENADGVAIGTDIKISGVKIGSVIDQSLDAKSFRAQLTLGISKDVVLSSDSSAKIASEGLLGSKYIAITPGGDEENLESGDEIQFTQSSVNLEELLGKFIFSSNSNKDKKDETSN
jgi:phospholipid/cholesterol/gamma-HCH transport system substrate-binding protein